MKHTVEPPLTDTSHRWTPLISGHHCSQLHTNTTFLTSHKRTPLLNGHFFWPRGCPLTGDSTAGSALPTEQMSHQLFSKHFKHTCKVDNNYMQVKITS